MIAGRCSGAAIGYTQDALNFQLTHHQLNDTAVTDKTRNTLLTGNYDFVLPKRVLAMLSTKALAWQIAKMPLQVFQFAKLNLTQN
jgi:hypothetical protein